MLKEEVLDLVEESRQKRWILLALNATHLALTPKEIGAPHPGKFHPISLCNVIYKIISKVVTNRPKILLPLLISLEQFGYVEGRQILDGIILSHEVFHSLKTTKTPGMILKLDLSKASNKLSNLFIEEMLLSFGFCQDWVQWILSLISSTFFSILVNGSPSSMLLSSRGICLGDPLSPFLFILMVEGLRHMIQSTMIDHTLRDLSLHNSPSMAYQ